MISKINEKRLKKINKFVSGKVLDVGYCDVPNIFLKNDVIGIDIDFKGCPKNYKECIKDKFENSGKHFKERSFDTIIAGEFIEHIENPIELFRISNSLLKKGGVLIISTPTPYYYKTILGNLFFPRGRLGGNHLNTFIPRILNNVAFLNGFKMKKVVGGNTFLPFLNWQSIYIFRKERELSDVTELSAPASLR